MPEKAARKVTYADTTELERSIIMRYQSNIADDSAPISRKRVDGGISQSTSDIAQKVFRSRADLTAHGYLKKELRYRENGSNSSNLYVVEKVL